MYAKISMVIEVSESVLIENVLTTGVMPVK